MLYLAQEPLPPAPLAAHWVAFLLIAGAFVALNIRGWMSEEHTTGPIAAFISVPIGIGAFGKFLGILNWTWVTDFSNWIHGLMSLPSKLAPFVWLLLALAMRSPQLFRGAKGPIAKVVKNIAAKAGLFVIIPASALGGLSMNAEDVWKAWLSNFAEIVRDFGEQIKLTLALFGAS